MSKIIEISDINATPYHYIKKLLGNNDHNYLFYNFGPYLVRNYSEIFFHNYTEVINPELKLLVALQLYSNLDAKPTSISEKKKYIQTVIERFSTPEYPQIRDMGLSILEKIRKYQYETKSLESAILSCAPIVQYHRESLVKPEMTKEYTTPLTVRQDEELDKIILDILKENAIEILDHADSIIDKITPENIRDIIYDLTIADSNIHTYYFLFVYLRYVKRYEKEIFVSDFNNLILNYNNLSKGRKADIDSTINAMTSILS